MKILVINAGSSSIKYQLFEMPARRVIASGLVERIGESTSRIKHKVTDGENVTREGRIADHRAGLAQVVELMMDEANGVIESASEIAAIGHRVVHGGEKFRAPTRITGEVKSTVHELISLAPLHNPANLAGIEVAEEIFPDAAQVAVFDTAFHQTMPDYVYRYAIPDELYEKYGIRSYGFHGTSHRYVSNVAAEHLGKPDARIITAHLGNGASMTAVRSGESVDSSMGFSPLVGLMMGTRSGDIDPAIILYLADKAGMSMKEIDHILNKKSGLLGVFGSNDMRDVVAGYEADDPAAVLALHMYTYRIKKYIGAYVAALGGVDAVVFTAGVGENSAVVRQMACDGLDALGIIVDRQRNQGDMHRAVNEIQTDESRVKVLVIPTNEELEIALQTAEIVGG